MSTLRPSLLLLAAGLLVGCPSGLNLGDDDSADLEPCAFAWGVPAGIQAVVVDPDADPGGNGSLQAPADSLQAGLDLARSNGLAWIVLTEGDFGGAPFTLGAEDAGLQIVGCGDGTVIKAAGTLGFDVLGGVSGVSLRELTIEDARVAVRVRDGAGSDTPIRLGNVAILDAVRLGIEIVDAGTRAELDGVNIDGVAADPAGDVLGYGILGSSADLVRIDGGSVVGATRAGVCLSASTFAVEGLMVSDTAPFDGSLGRGFQIQDGATGTLQSVGVFGSSDAGLFVLASGDVAVTGSTFADTQAVDVPDAPAGTTSGAGIVATSGVLVEPGDTPEPMNVTITGTTVGDNSRLGLLLEGWGTAATLTDVTLSNNFLPDEGTFPISDAPFFQLGAEVEVISGEAAVELTDDNVQTVYREALSVGDE